MVHVLIGQEGADVGGKLQQFFKSITEWNQNAEFVTSLRHTGLAGGYLRITETRVFRAITFKVTVVRQDVKYCKNTTTETAEDHEENQLCLTLLQYHHGQ